MIQDQVQEMLERRADGVRPDPDAWQRIVDRIEGGDAAGPLPTPVRSIEHRARPRRLMAMAATTAVALGVGVTVSTLGDDGDVGGLLEAAAPPETTPETTGPQMSAVPAAVPLAAPVWPSTSESELTRLQLQADRGEHTELTEPRAAAGAYLSDRLPAGSSFSVGGYLELAPGVGEVKYELPADSGRGGVVHVRRFGSDRSIWVVTGSTSSKLLATEVRYDGEMLLGEVVSELDGSLELTIASSDGSDPVSTERTWLSARKPYSLRRMFAGKPGLVVLLRHDHGLAETRVEAQRATK